MTWPVLVKRTSSGIVAAGQAEVDDHRLAPLARRLDHDVGRLQVAVDDPLGVRLLHGQGELAHQRRGLARRQALVADRLRQRLALDVGHRQVEPSPSISPTS